MDCVGHIECGRPLRHFVSKDSGPGLGPATIVYDSAKPAFRR